MTMPRNRQDLYNLKTINITKKIIMVSFQMIKSLKIHPLLEIKWELITLDKLKKWLLIKCTKEEKLPWNI